MKEGTAEGRRSAQDALVKLRDQIVELKVYFKAEQQVLETIIELLSHDGQTTVDLETTLSGLRTTRSDEDRAAAARKDEKGSELERLAAPVMKKFTAAAAALPGAGSAAPAKDPWLFTEVFNEPHVTVVIMVPEATKARDCEVNIQASTVKVVVKGHERQPVVHGNLAGAVDAEACGWSIEGSGR